MLELVIARNPDGGSSLPFVVALPVGYGVVLATKDTWPRTAAVCCHQLPEWRADADVIERLDIVSCVRRGAATEHERTRSYVVTTSLRERPCDRENALTARVRGVARRDGRARADGA